MEKLSDEMSDVTWRELNSEKHTIIHFTLLTKWTTFGYRGQHFNNNSFCIEDSWSSELTDIIFKGSRDWCFFFWTWKEFFEHLKKIVPLRERFVNAQEYITERAKIFFDGRYESIWNVPDFFLSKLMKFIHNCKEMFESEWRATPFFFVCKTLMTFQANISVNVSAFFLNVRILFFRKLYPIAWIFMSVLYKKKEKGPLITFQNLIAIVNGFRRFVRRRSVTFQ